MRGSIVSMVGLSTLALTLGWVSAASGATTIASGQYIGQAGSSSATGPGGNGGPGYAADGVSGSGAPYTITGGTFDGGLGGYGGGFTVGYNGGNGGDALDVSAPTTITGGIFLGNNGNFGGFGTISNGTGGLGGNGVDVLSSTLSVFGGMYYPGPGSSPGNDTTEGYVFVDSGGAITVYGTFTGGPRTITSGIGTFTGTLTDNTASAAYTYDITGGSITLADAPVPEPTTASLLAIGSAGLLARRRRHA